MANQTSPATNHYFQSEAWVRARAHSAWKSFERVLNDKPAHLYQRPSLLGTVLHLPGYQPEPAGVLELSQRLREISPHPLTCKLETCAPYDEVLARELESQGWMKARPTQYAFTVQLDLTKDVGTLTRELKKRARNELNRARNHGVQVREVEPDDEHLEIMYRLLAHTSSRKRFSIHDRHFAFIFWQNIRQSGRLKLFFAEHEGHILAAAVMVISQDGKKAWYKEGASTTLQPAINAPRLLLWEAALVLKAAGTEVFDLGGIPDPATYELSGMKGIFIFKTAYTGEVIRMMPAYELPLSPVRYKLWPKLELVLRKIAQQRGRNWY